jgi:uncharacterized membrane protein
MLKICSNYPADLWVSIMFYSPETCGGDGGDFETMGWWTLSTGACANVYANDLEDLNRYWYYFAEAADGAVWAGPYQAYVPNEAFNDCYGTGVSGRRIVGFRQLDIGDADDFTLTLIP